MNAKKEYQEALNYLKANCEQWVVNEDYRKNGKILDTTFEESDKSSELLQELVDKETPLNLPLHHGVYMQCKCEAMNEVHSNYCWNCGQALDWSKE